MEALANRKSISSDTLHLVKELVNRTSEPRRRSNAAGVMGIHATQQFGGYFGTSRKEPEMRALRLLLNTLAQNGLFSSNLAVEGLLPQLQDADSNVERITTNVLYAYGTTHLSRHVIDGLARLLQHVEFAVQYWAAELLSQQTNLPGPARKALIQVLV